MSLRFSLARFRSRMPFWICNAAGFYIFFGGLISFSGWLFDIYRLADWAGIGIAIQPNTTVAAMLGGAALILIAAGRQKIAVILGIGMGLIGVVTIFETFTGIHLGIDTLLMFDREWGRSGTLVQGRMGPPASVSWTVGGIAFLCLALAPRWRRAIPIIGLLVLAVSSVSIAGYIFGANTLYALPKLTAIALQTATFLFALGIGLLMTAPEHEPARTLFSDSGGGVLARWALPFVIFLPIIVGLLRHRGEVLGFYDTQFGTALLTVVEVILLLVVLWLGVRSVRKREIDLEEATAARQASIAELSDREHFIGAILGSITDAFYAVDAEWRFTFVNETVLERNRMKRSDFIGKNLWELFPDSLNSKGFEMLHRAMTERVSVEYEIFYDPWQRWLSDTVYPSADGGLAIFSRDVTESRAAEQALAESEERFRAAAGAVSDVIWTNTADGRMSGPQPGWERFTGQTPEEYEGYGWSEAVHPDDSKPTIDAWIRAVARTTTFIFEHRVRRHDGEWRLCAIRAVPIFSVQGDVREWVGVHTDVTEQRRAEDELRKANSRKDEFLATLAHELRNPLAPMANSLELLRRAGGDESLAVKARETVERQLSHMVRLIDDLLDLSRITSDKLELRREQINLSEIVENAAATCRITAEGQKRELTVVVPSNPIFIDGDPVRITQVISNLLANACKFTPAGGRVTLAAQTEGDIAEVRITDSGIGIPHDMLDRIFEMFTQVDRSMEHSRGGLGIGLSLARKIVEMHGGTINAFSDGPGTGSEFVLYLPAVIKQKQERVDPDNPNKFEASPQRILVVDDNIDSAESLALLLKYGGHETKMAFDGIAALDEAARFRPDVILLDIGLPGMNGLDVCRTIREESWGKNIFIVAMTGWGQEEDRRMSKEAGFNNHLVKPIDYSSLIELLAEENPVPR